MIERPSKERVIGALNYQHSSDSRDASREWEALDVLAAEVHALRVERDSWQQAHVELTKLLGDTQGLLRDVERDRDWQVASCKALQVSQERLAIELRECQRHRDLAREASEAAELRIVELRAELSAFRGARAVGIEQITAERDRLKARLTAIAQTGSECWRPQIKDLPGYECKCEACATIARVEALLAEWRKRSPNPVPKGRCGTDHEFCTDGLDQALRGGQ